MLHAFRLGPIEFLEGDQLVYAALGDVGPVQPVFARSDEEGLRDLVAAAGGEPVQCEPGLATAARSLGLRSGRLPPEALQFRASLAMALALGPEASTIGARELEALVAAFARFWKARTWERFDSDIAVPVVVADRGRSGVQEASVMGKGGEQFGVALYPEAGSVARMARLVDEDRLDEVEQVPSISVTLQDEPRYVVRAMDDAHGVPGFPTPLAVGGGGMKLASAADVRLLTAALDAFVSMMPHRREGRGVAGDGSDRCEASVAMPSPGSTQAQAPAGAADPVRARLRTSRNAPCPCGSGKKYKKCHLAEDEERVNGPAREEERRLAERAAVHSIDDRLTDRMLRLAERRWGRKFDGVDALGAIKIPAQEAEFFSAFAAHHFPGPEGISPRELLLREEGRRLTPEERAWLDAQAAALVSVWEVMDVAPGQGISLRNLLGDEERFVREVAGSRVLKPRDTLLGRVVDHAGGTFLCGIHPRPLPPREGSLVVKAIRKAVRSRARVVPRNKLLEAAADGRLLGLWQTAALAMARRSLPELRNTDGERLLLTTDHYTVSPGSAPEVRARLSAISGAQVVEEAGGVARIAFTRPGHTMSSALENTIVGAAEIDGDALRLSTNSVERADALRAIVMQACAGLVTFRAREHADPEAALRRGGPPGGLGSGGEGEQPPELQAMVRAVKEKHYQAWLGERIPALGGLTPREAARGKAKDQQALALLVAEIENHEARLPEGQRFDVVGLRRELGLPG